MTVARDMIKQLGLNIYVEGLNNMVSGRSTAWVRYDLPARDKPFQFALRKVYGDLCLQDVDAWENIGKKLIREITQETGYNVDDINYSFCDEVRQYFIEQSNTDDSLGQRKGSYCCRLTHKKNAAALLHLC